MKFAFMIIVFVALSCFAASANMVVADGSGSPTASVKVEKFDPPAKLDKYNQLTKIVTLTNIPGAPGVVLHIPCIRSKMSPNNPLGEGGVLVSPGVVEDCKLQRIPSGRFAGILINTHGEMITPNG